MLDLAGPVEIVNTFVLDPVEPEPARLVIDLVPTTRARLRGGRRPRSADARRRRSGVPGPVAPGSASGKPVVVIDPGHGGIDSGAVGKDGLLEKDVTLKFGLALARHLQLGAELEPVLTRDGDDFLSLGDRVTVARQHHAALFVSIHADIVARTTCAAPRSIRCPTTLPMPSPPPLRRARTAPTYLPASPCRISRTTSPTFSSTWRGGRPRIFRSASPRRWSATWKARFRSTETPGAAPPSWCCSAPDVPSVLFELGYLSNAEDEALFKAPDWPGPAAERVARAIEQFFGHDIAAGQ